MSAPNRMSPKSEALAFRIWRYANPLGWDCTAGEIADAIRSTPSAVGRIAHAKGWATRLRGGKIWNDTRNRCGTPGGVGETILAGELKRQIVARYSRLAEEPSE